MSAPGVRVPDGSASDVAQGEPSGPLSGTGLLLPADTRRRTAPRLAAVAVVVGAGVLAAVVTSLAPVPADPQPEPATLAQYDYALRLPAGWRHSGGEPERRRTLLTPAAAPAGSDLISIEQTPLGYDSTAEPDRAHRELADRFAEAADADPTLDRATRRTAFAGREVIGYRQTLVRAGATVDWYVLFDRDAQLSVGCQHTPSGAGILAVACAEVVASLARRN